MKKSEILKYVGSMQQVAYARRIAYDEGRARNLNAIEVKNGPLYFVIMLDKCMDISEMSWRGENINFISKPGLNGRNPFDTNGGEAQRSIMGGLFFTCGYENICAPYGKYPMHGRMRTSPAEHISINTYWENDNYIIEVSGDIREAELFGENLLLHRTIKTVYNNPSIEIKDEVYNEAFRDETLMLMYHCNVGYPLLTEESRVLLPSNVVTPRDEITSNAKTLWTVMDEPKDNQEEYVYLHDLKANANGDTFAAVVNDKMNMGLLIEFNKNSFPYFGQWKSTASGDYVMGLEPGNSMVYGRKYHEDQGNLPVLKSQSNTEYKLKFSIVEGTQISDLEKRLK